MSTKVFKVGEYGYSPFYRLTVSKGCVSVTSLDSTKKPRENTDVRAFLFENIDRLQNYLFDETTSYYADKMIEWLKSTKEWKALTKCPLSHY